MYPYGTKDPLKTARCFTAKVAVEDVAVEADIIVIEGKNQALLGRETATQLKVLSLTPNVCVCLFARRELNSEIQVMF